MPENLQKEVAMDEISVKNLQKEIKSLGIINIEADGDLSPSLLKDAVEAVKGINLDFDSLAKEMNRVRNNPQK